MLYNSCTRLAVVSLRGLSAETASLLYNSEVVFFIGENMEKQVSEKHFKKILSSIGFPDELEKIKQYNAKTHTKSN